MKLLVIPSTTGPKQLDVDGYILPLEEFSVSYSRQYNMDEIRDCLSWGKEVFVVINKNIFNAEIPMLEETLKMLDAIKVTGVFFYDLSVLSIVRRLNLSLFLVWNQTHMVTNYNTIHYYLSKGVQGALLSNEITLDEMVEIRKHTKSKLFANVVYRPVMSFSRRHLLSNYCKTAGIPVRSQELTIHEKISKEDFFVREEKDGTALLSGHIVNGIRALLVMVKNDFDYGIIDLSCLDLEVGNLCLDSARKVVSGAENVDFDRIDKRIGNYTGFLYKKTVYRVK